MIRVGNLYDIFEKTSSTEQTIIDYFWIKTSSNFNDNDN